MAVVIVPLFKLSEYTFRGSNSAIFIVTSPLIGDQVLKESICS